MVRDRFIPAALVLLVAQVPGLAQDVPPAPDTQYQLLPLAGYLREAAKSFRKFAEADQHLSKDTLAYIKNKAREADKADREFQAWLERLPLKARIAFRECVGNLPGSAGSFYISMKGLLQGEKPRDAYPGLAKEADQAANWIEGYARCWQRPGDAIRAENQKKAEEDRKQKEEQVQREREEARRREEAKAQEEKEKREREANAADEKSRSDSKASEGGSSSSGGSGGSGTYDPKLEKQKAVMNQVREIERSRQEAQAVVSQGMTNIASTINEIQARREAREAQADAERQARENRIADKYEKEKASRGGNRELLKEAIAEIDKTYIGVWEVDPPSPGSCVSSTGRIQIFWENSKLQAKGRVEHIDACYKKKRVVSTVVIDGCDFDIKRAEAIKENWYLDIIFKCDFKRSKFSQSFFGKETLEDESTGSEAMFDWRGVLRPRLEYGGNGPLIRMHKLK